VVIMSEAEKERKIEHPLLLLSTFCLLTISLILLIRGLIFRVKKEEEEAVPSVKQNSGEFFISGYFQDETSLDEDELGSDLKKVYKENICKLGKDTVKEGTVIYDTTCASESEE